MIRLTRRALTLLLALGLSATLTACGPDLGERDGQDGQELPIGDDVDVKADGSWGPYPTRCKAIPTRTPLTAPKIFVSLNGLTLHLTDAPSGLSRVYPIGAGKINRNAGETTTGKSLSMYPLLSTKKQDFTIVTADVNPCKIWWTDPDSGQKSPVFAGLPFLSWYGSYGMHGPITGYTAPNGGQLQRGFVSHGCLRMEAADVSELWAYVRKVKTVPVHVQPEVERDASGLAVDVPQKWILSECRVDADCNYAGGVCLRSASTAATAPGFCSARCTSTCADRYGYPTTFCVSDGKSPAQGFCTARSSDFNAGCVRHAGFKSVASVARYNQPSVTTAACVPSLPLQ